MRSYLLPAALLLCIILFAWADAESRKRKPVFSKLFTYKYDYEIEG